MAFTIIDLRSDTMTQPTAGMRQAMANAEVGDDLFGEDPSANRLQAQVAEMLGKEAALFMTSGTMGNQVAIGVHTRPGMEVILEADSHSFHFETGATAMLSGVQVHTVQGERGILTAEQIERAIRPNADYYPATGMIQLENTHNMAGGTIYPLETLQDIRQLARKRALPVHLDGARLWHAHIATGVSLADYAACADSVSLCFSKGLGAPVGSILVGSKVFIQEAARFRKAFGGAMRQMGVLAAAAEYAMEHHLERLADDHSAARGIAGGLQDLPGIELDMSTVETNMVYAGLSVPKAAEWVAAADNAGVRMLAIGDARVRLVPHLDVSAEDIPRAIDILRKTYEAAVTTEE
jgi:threonine aldolase